MGPPATISEEMPLVLGTGPDQGMPMPGRPSRSPQPQGSPTELWWLNGVPVTVPGLQELVESSVAARALGPPGAMRRLEGRLEHTHRVPGDGPQKPVRTRPAWSRRSAFHPTLTQPLGTCRA